LKIGVIGLGTIGLKLVEYLSENNFYVIACSRNIEAKKTLFNNNIDTKVKYNKISYDRLIFIQNNVKFTDEISLLAECGLIIECLKETYSVKKEYIKLLKDLNKEIPLASTTSSLNIVELSKAYHSGYFIGLHFFNTPTKMKLVELSFLPETLPQIKSFTYQFLNKLSDKKVIEIPFVQGYIVNNILFAYLNFAFEFKLDKSINIQDIDEAMKLGTNMPMGPFELADYIGIDIVLEILEELYKTSNDYHFRPCSIIKKMVAQNKLGRKTKLGFYEY